MQQTLPKTLRILLAIFFALVPLDYVLPHIGNSTMLTPVGAIIAVWCLGDIFLRHHGKIILPREEIALIFVVVLSIVSVLWAENTAAWSAQMRSFLMTAAMYALLMTYRYTEKDLQFVENAAIIGGGLLVIYVFTQVNLSLVFAGYRLDFNNIGGSDFSDPNGLAGRLMMSFVCLMKQVLTSEKFWKKIGCFVLLALLAYMLFLTGSRGGILAMAITVLPIIFTFAKGRQSRLLLAVVPMLLVIILYLPKLMPEHIYDRIFNLEKYLEVTTLEGDRIDIWIHLLSDLFPNAPLWGYGAGQSAIAMTQVYGRVKAIHNSVLLFLGDLGLLGFIPWVYYIVQKIRYAFLVRKKNPFCLSVMLAVLIMGLILDASKEKYLWNAFLFAYMNYSVHILNPEKEKDTAS